MTMNDDDDLPLSGVAKPKFGVLQRPCSKVEPPLAMIPKQT